MSDGELTEEEAQQRISALEYRLKALQARSMKTPFGLIPETRTARTAREMAAGQVPEPPVPRPLTLDNPAGIPGALWDRIKGTVGNLQGQDVTNALQDAASGATLGLSDKAADLVGMDSPEKRDARRAENPLASQIAQGAGAVASSAAGPLRYLGQAGGGLLGMAESRVPALATSGLGRIAGQAAVGAGTGAVAGGVQAATQGQDIGAGMAGGAFAGGAFGGGAQLVSEGVGAAARGLANTAAGKAADILRPPPKPNGAPQPTGPASGTAPTVLAEPPAAPPPPAPVPGAPPPHPDTIEGFLAAQQAEQQAAQQAAEEQARQTLAFKGPGLTVHGHGPMSQALGMLPAAAGGALTYGLMSGHPLYTLGAAGIALGARNAGPIAGRALLPAARAVAPALGGLGPSAALPASLSGIEDDVASAKARVRKKKSPRNE